jgi:hypothetical protein
MRTLATLRGIRNPYARRILSLVLGKDPVKILEATPGRLRTLTRGLTRRELLLPPSRGKWSIAQLVCHLSDAEVVLAWRLRMAIAQNGCRLQAMDERKWARHLGYHTLDLASKLRAFRGMRLDHLRTMKSLTPSEWKRYGLHEERGKETVARLAQMAAGHELNHLAQIERIRNILLKRRK